MHGNPYPVPTEPGDFLPVRIGAWQNGYDAGISRPPTTPPTPLVRSPDYAEAWAQGAEAGNADGRLDGWRWAYFDRGPRPDADGGAEVPYGPRDSGETGQAESADYAQSWPCVGEPPLRVVLAHFAPGSEDANGLTGRLLARACADKGVTRLYLPVGLSESAPGSAPETGPETAPGSTPASQPADDPLADAGHWHGAVSESLAEAGEEAFRWVTSSRVPRRVGLLRYEPAAEHHFFDLLPWRTAL
ncbi:hypothetical protein [Streptomyces mangrovisoli]|uniref:Uncharacterized protein n=1 Tax=Streptomyces mangrovisoli TaxID=1428628 RepID=A0A1J4NMY8_9ACTN|nr:hypothetical protein [Streptomyces mangrovisoli]OIJ63711.1 hypothetical protein WN71_033445 [Streptomyces mangrovisoli]